MIDINNHKIKFHESSSNWIRAFSLKAIKCLIVCRGPVRKEAMDVFDEIGIKEYGILLSEKDSVVYPQALAPEMRGFKYINNIHRVPDYMGSSKEEKTERIQDIINIALHNSYTHIFAGYGFMAEDAEFIEAIEKSGITFMGPASSVARQAGAKDEAKKIARKLNVSVTPGIDTITALSLLRKAENQAKLESLAKDNKLDFIFNSTLSLEENAEALLQLSYVAGMDLVTIEDLQVEAEKQCQEIWKKYPKNRIRFKYIGGGGGKGQRVIGDLSEVKSAVMEIIAESKVVSQGSNRNFLIELNIENTRHNEIQLIGNGDWCISLGGRDCSLQMHEQKLLELSYTVELFEEEIGAHLSNPARVAMLKEDLQTLKEMEEQSERFGSAVKLDSVSTFESIVDGKNHFFMEMNTRIQVEHRVTEMVYKLKFTNPNDPNDFFIIESLIEAMALLSLHGKVLPKPTRLVRNIAGGEARINATNQSLQPHAGGLIQNWSPPVEHEIRDDQGIGIKNPDTGIFIHYRLAGAYDSNIALLVTYGKSRKENLERLASIIRVTELRGNDLQTNMPVHYGLINWILGKDPMFKPNTRFMMSYLAGVGSLYTIIKNTDIDMLWDAYTKQIAKSDPALSKILLRKLTLLLRPIRMILNSPHILAGFLGYHNGISFQIVDKKVKFLRNPLEILKDLYTYLDLDSIPQKPACDKIWDHDDKILAEGLDFYSNLSDLLGMSSYEEIEKSLHTPSTPNPDKINQGTWEKCTHSHKAFQVGLDLLKILPAIGDHSEFLSIDINDSLEAVVPVKFSDPESSKEFIKELNPPPKAKSDEIVAPMGGMFYSREAPNLPQLTSEGDSFKIGQPLFIIEVMKMFNKVSAPFSGKILKNMLKDSDGRIVTKGQVVFKIQPDDVLKEETPEQIQIKKKSILQALQSY
jgi:acetyl/propionyl-CoA carboxylase alpha subunit